MIVRLLIRKSLTQRPELRNSSNEENINTHLDFNRWLVAYADKTSPKMDLIDISGKDIS